MKIVFLCESCKNPCRSISDYDYCEEIPELPEVCHFGLQWKEWNFDDELTESNRALIGTDKSDWTIENSECSTCDGSGTVFFREDSGFYHYGGGRAYITGDKPCDDCDGTGHTHISRSRNE